MPTGTRRAARNRLLAAAALAAGPLWASEADIGGTGGDPRHHVAEEAHLGIVVRIDAYVPSGVNPAVAFRAAFDRVAALERILSSHREDSETRRIEEQAWREPIPVSQEWAHLVQSALRLARETKGAFDPTLGQVTRLQRRSQRSGAPPPPDALRLAWARTGWRQVSLRAQGGTVFLRRRGIQFDFGGIAKGYIADEALAELRKLGVRRALVALAGDIAAGDPPPGQAGWTVALDAVGPQGSVERHVRLRHQAVSTSGSREQTQEVAGRICSHIVAPGQKTCADARRAVSVVAASGLEADGLATALAVLGPEASRRILARRKNVQAYWASNAP